MLQILGEHNIDARMINGSTLTCDRNTIVSDFSQGQFKCLVLSTLACGEGLNLQTANHVILVDSWFNPATELQAVARGDRHGQTNHVYVYRFGGAGTYQVKLSATAEQKLYQSSRIVDKAVTLQPPEDEQHEWLTKVQDFPSVDASKFPRSDDVVIKTILEEKRKLTQSILDMRLTKREREVIIIDEDRPGLVNIPGHQIRNQSPSS